MCRSLLLSFSYCFDITSQSLSTAMLMLMVTTSTGSLQLLPSFINELVLHLLSFLFVQLHVAYCSLFVLLVLCRIGWLLTQFSIKVYISVEQLFAALCRYIVYPVVQPRVQVFCSLFALFLLFLLLLLKECNLCFYFFPHLQFQVYCFNGIQCGLVVILSRDRFLMNVVKLLFIVVYWVSNGFFLLSFKLLFLALFLKQKLNSIKKKQQQQ